jgi:hypothetical protein
MKEVLLQRKQIAVKKSTKIGNKQGIAKNWTG